MTYLSRPVFDVIPNWDVLPSRPFSYDLREILLGFGAPVYAPTSPYITQGWEFTVTCEDAAQVQALEAFFDACQGRLKGFWFPAQRVAGVVVSGAGTALTVTRTNLVADDHIWLSTPGSAPICRRITAVSGSDTKTLTLDTALPAGIDTRWTLLKLLYVRWASDELAGEVIGEGHIEYALRVVELPTEYADAELGTRPVILYRFFSVMDDGEVEWLYTSHLAPIPVGETTYAPLAISHDAIRLSSRSERHEATINTWNAPTSPWSRFVTVSLGRPLWVSIIEAEIENPEAGQVLFTGRVRRPEFDGRKVTLRCESWLDVLASKIPRCEIGPRCNWHLYGAGCGLDRDDFKVEATISAVSGYELTITAAGLDKPAHWFANGLIEAGTGDTLETRTVIASTAADDEEIVLTLNLPLMLSTVGATVTVLPGCDHTAETCLSPKFDNFENFGGFRHVPQDNLSVKAVVIDSANGNKK